MNYITACSKSIGQIQYKLIRQLAIRVCSNSFKIGHNMITLRVFLSSSLISFVFITKTKKYPSLN